MTAINLTFHNLKILLKKRVELGEGVSSSSLPNLMSALNGFLEERNLPVENQVGTVLRASYYKELRQHVETLRIQGRTAAYISNRKSLLTIWRRCVIEHDRYCATVNKQSHPFQAALCAIFDNGKHTKRGVARGVGIPLATLRRWTEGTLPNSKSIYQVTRLERYLGFASGALTDLLSVKAGRKVDAKPTEIEYRKRLKTLSKKKYLLDKPSQALRKQWLDYLVYKVSEEPDDGEDVGLKRSRGGRWSSTTKHPVKNHEKTWYALYGGRYVPTAAIAWQRVAAFMGWLMLPHHDGGAGMSAEEAQSLANFTKWTLLRDYLEWSRERAAGIAHAGLFSFLKFAASLCNPATGYLTQKGKEFFLEHSLDAEKWRARCHKTFESIKRFAAALDDDAMPSRNSLEPIRVVLALPNPLDAIASMVLRMSESKPSGLVEEAVWRRDLLFVKLMASNPLRIKNFTMLTYKEDNSGHLRREENGGWSIFVPRRELKNFKGAARERDYHMSVRREVWADIESYLNWFRGILAKSVSDFVFVSRTTGGQFSEKSLGRRFFQLTKEYLSGCPGAGPHSMRHIVATSILKSSPNDWNAAAWALHDREDTVRKHYAHLARHDAAKWMSGAMDGPFSRM